MNATQPTTTPALTYTVLPLPEFPTCISDSQELS